MLWSAHVAKRYLEAGFTSCVGAACAKARLDVVTRNAINEGLIPGPRYLAASQEITVAGGLGDETLPHAPWQEFSFGIIVSGPEEMRKWVRMFLKYGVDSIKLNLSGDNFVPGAGAETTWMSDEEVAVAVSETKMRGKRVAAHARSCASIKQCVRHGIEVIYHASFIDDEALDMLEARKDRHFVAPGIAILYAMLNEAEAYGISRSKAISMGYQIEWDAALESLSKMHKRGIRVLPGGDYGFAFTPHCQNARDLEFFVKYLGMTPMEAILSATKLRRRDHDARQRARPAEGRIPRRPDPRRRRPAVESRGAARADAHAGRDEGRRVLQGAADPVGALTLGEHGGLMADGTERDDGCAGWHRNAGRRAVRRGGAGRVRRWFPWIAIGGPIARVRDLGDRRQRAAVLHHAAQRTRRSGRSISSSRAGSRWCSG